MQINPIIKLNDGRQMPLIGLGTLNIRNNDKHFSMNDLINKAITIGYRHFDIVNNESLIGQGLKLMMQVKRPIQNQQGQSLPNQFQYLYPRTNLFITYKVHNSINILTQVQQALNSTKLQYFDLIMLNCTSTPPPVSIPNQANQELNQENQDKPIQTKLSTKQAWKMLQECKNRGMTLSIGVSNFTLQALINLIPFTDDLPAVNQIQCHPYNIQKNMINFCKKHHIAITAYCPLMRGGKDQKHPLGDKIDYMSQPILKSLSEKYSRSIPQIILNYQVSRGVAVIPKTQKYDHLVENFSCTDFQLLPEDVLQLESLDRLGKAKVYQLKNLPIWKGQDPLC